MTLRSLWSRTGSAEMLFSLRLPGEKCLFKHESDMCRGARLTVVIQLLNPPTVTKRGYTAELKFLSAISPCEPTYLNLYFLALITLTSLFTERNNAAFPPLATHSHSLSLHCLSSTKLDRSQIKDQAGRFHYQAILLLCHANILLKPSAIIFPPSRCRHGVMASTVNAVPSSCLFFSVCVCGDNGSFPPQLGQKHYPSQLSGVVHTHTYTHYTCL